MQLQTKSNEAHTRNVRNFLSRTLCAGIALLTAVNVATAGNGPRMIEVSDDTQTYTGMIVAKSAQECFLVDRFGRQARLPIAGLKSFSVVAESFRPASQSEFRRQLEAELGPEYEVATSKHYVVAGTRGHGRSYAALFEDIFNQVDSFYALRGFRTSEPDAPLVALVLKDQAAFSKYCEGDQMAWTEGLRGYYSLKSNRVVMYDLPELFQSVRLTPETDLQTVERHSSQMQIPQLVLTRRMTLHIPWEASWLSFSRPRPHQRSVVKRRIRSFTKQHIRWVSISAFILASAEHLHGFWKAWRPYWNRPA